MTPTQERNLKVRAEKVKEVKSYRIWKKSVKDHEKD